MKEKLLFLGVAVGTLLLSGCKALQESDRQAIEYLKSPSGQVISFDSLPSGAACDVLLANRKTWSQIPEVKEYRKAFGYGLNDEAESIWQKGITLKEVPAGSQVIHKSVTMPAKLKVKRGADLLIVSCQKLGYQSHVQAYSYRDNIVSEIGNLADPTWVVGDYLDSVTGVAYYHVSKVTVLLEK